jgi:hypothetical protein
LSADSVAIIRLAAASAFLIVSTLAGSDCSATSNAFLKQLVKDIPGIYAMTLTLPGHLSPAVVL